MLDSEPSYPIGSQWEKEAPKRPIKPPYPSPLDPPAVAEARILGACALVFQLGCGLTMITWLLALLSR
jgi:hypothetical protein